MNNSRYSEPECLPIMTIDLKKSRIRIYKLTLHILDDPEYIQFFVKPGKKMFAILRSTPEDIAPQKIYWKTLVDKRQCCEFHSKPLITRLRKLIDTKPGDYTYKVIGSKNTNYDRVLFDLSTAEPINEEPEVEDTAI